MRPALVTEAAVTATPAELAMRPAVRLVRAAPAVTVAVPRAPSVPLLSSAPVSVTPSVPPAQMALVAVAVVAVVTVGSAPSVVVVVSTVSVSVRPMLVKGGRADGQVAAGRDLRVAVGESAGVDHQVAAGLQPRRGRTVVGDLLRGRDHRWWWCRPRWFPRWRWWTRR